MDPAQGRFTTRDMWEGDYNDPLSLNRWNYTNGNPINYTDPAGLCLTNNLAECFKGYYTTPQGDRSAMIFETDLQPGLKQKSPQDKPHSNIIQTTEMLELADAVYRTLLTRDTPALWFPTASIPLDLGWRDRLSCQSDIPLDLPGYFWGFLYGRGKFDTPFFASDGPDTLVSLSVIWVETPAFQAGRFNHSQSTWTSLESP